MDVINTDRRHPRLSKEINKVTRMILTKLPSFTYTFRCQDLHWHFESLEVVLDAYIMNLDLPPRNATQPFNASSPTKEAQITSSAKTSSSSSSWSTMRSGNGPTLELPNVADIGKAVMFTARLGFQRWSIRRYFSWVKCEENTATAVTECRDLICRTVVRIQAVFLDRIIVYWICVAVTYGPQDQCEWRVSWIFSSGKSVPLWRKPKCDVKESLVYSECPADRDSLYFLDDLFWAVMIQKDHC